MWGELLSVFLVFFVTFLLFPGVAIVKTVYRGELGSGSAYLGSGGWWGVVLLAVFNVFDTVGRFLPAYPNLVPVSRAGLLPATLARFVFVPLLVGCVKGWPGMGDITTLFAMMFFAMTNGCFASREFAWQLPEG